MATTKGAKPQMSSLYAEPTEDYDEPTPTSRLTFTPCTRMSNLTLASQSTTENNGRTRFFSYNQRPATDFNTKLKRAFAGEQDTQSHPNLSMVVGGEKISFDRLQKDMHGSGMLFHSDEDESEEDEEDLLRAYSSPEHSPSSSPEQFTLDSIFDMNVKMPTPQGFGDNPLVVQQQPQLQLHDDNLDDDDDDGHYDPTFSWVNQVFEDSDEHDDDLVINESYYYVDDGKDNNNSNNNSSSSELTDNENLPPTSSSNSSTKRGKTRSWACSNSSSSSRSSSSTSSSTISSTPLSPVRRAPLQELPLDETTEDNNDKLHPRKKMILNNKKSIGDYRTPIPSSSSSSSRKSFMRALSPSSSRKGKEPAPN
ncbi:hypothetical protein BDB00DRAFT_867572 [Zychaea mexicana]|uniref:uncharacterized protein n=1 Tax=Zychaea mexicana TaxID=64656 RepID=UPI0022FE7062|nr:uncharacterized protein BDB00DRAFT_867572 [Zychaea mexicana]KAI9498418.1 hypothetical protein BDB00DRAFT_867572 [Zychaea mexicana]